MQSKPLTKADFSSDQEVRWCPGCGDYAILAAVQRMLPNLGIDKEKIVFISGIGCSSRFPYYMNTYGFHTIHGRALTIATGLACTRPDLTVFVITGDGDALSIGGNHFLHALRRNVNLNVLCFNNKIYGLTKGQYSPTSEVGKKTKSTPYGSIDTPLSAMSLALAAEGSFVARSVDIFAAHLTETLEAAVAHKGLSFVEIYQNCNIFNDGAHAEITDKDKRDDNILYLEAGKAMVFGKNNDKGIVMNAANELAVVQLGKDKTEKDCLVHSTDVNNLGVHHQLAKMNVPDFPVPMGIVRQHARPTYDQLINEQLDAVIQQKGEGNLQELIKGPQTWTVG
ncbi:MAG TPA: 2-oxoacid:ferredoxin oxidoreductase subunit beta [Oligoflexia bacterium]|nr:2-oxoacid:ferredoxin oxidoreductase subunit beta [Oligoflexia bacterium]HMR25101.1 2-oxoacid:ferredoxin oxidoreductase subunit beta [Oligoflexia bacterium]